MTKRIMREFRIDEISAVDRPAQAAALATIIKRDAKPAAPVEHHTDTYHGDETPALRALAKRLDEAAKRREAREQETRTMQTAAAENDDHVAFRKLADDAERSMTSYIAKRGRNVSRTDAAEQWRRDNPDQYEALNKVGPRPSPVVAKRTAALGFQKLVDQVVERDHCPRHVAMEVVRKSDPSAFKAYQAGA
jgi:hypothetical protein